MMSEPIDFQGVFPILPTPFHEDESVDHESYANMVRFMAAIGVSGVTILGVLGEANRLTDDERRSIIETVVDAAGGRIPVVVGTSHSGTRATVALSEMAADRGASALMVTPHREAVPSEARIFEHFATVNNDIGLPIVLQDHPGSTDVSMSLELVLRMVDELPNIACIKQEALPSPGRVAALKTAMVNRNVPILTGLGALYGYFELAAGADGFMTGFAFPEVLMALTAAEPDVRWDLYARFLPLIVFEGQPGVAIRKQLFKMRGLMTSATVRRPGAEISANARLQLQDVLERVLRDADITRQISI